MDVTYFDISDIDFQDQTFFLGNNSDISSIKSSIREIGVLNPPILKSVDGKYQIVTGWKRLRSCRELGYVKVLVKVYNHQELSDEDCLKVMFADNTDRITDLELAELILLYKNLCEHDNKSLISEILPQLQITSTRKHLDKYLSLASLDRSIKDAYYEGSITIEQCHMLSEIMPDNQVPILKYLLLKYNLNNNESRQVIQLIEEITLRDLKSVDEIVLEAQVSADTSNFNKNVLILQLKSLRYPDLTRTQKRYLKTVEELKFPNNVRLLVDQYFEGNEIEFRIKVKSSDELPQILTKISDSLKSGKIRKLLKIVTKGVE